MTTAGFGAPGTPGKVDEPYSHSPEPVEPGPDADMLPVLAPAGTVHMSILDFAKHAAFHLTGEPGLVSWETLELLHTPVGETYGLGRRRNGLGGRALTHAGPNGMSYAVIGLLPVKNLGVVAACNLGTDAGAEVCSAAFKTFVGAYGQ